MSLIRFVFILAFTGILLSTCVKEAAPGPKQNPFVITLNVKNNDNTGVTLSANLTDAGSDEILEYGFVYGTEEKPTLSSFCIPMDAPVRTGEYSHRLTSGLEKGKMYFVRAYIKTSNYVVYGNMNSFTSNGSFGPVIYGFSPAHGHAGTRVVITGENFGMVPEMNVVKFGDLAAIVDSASLNRLVVTAPVLNVNNDVPVSLEVAGKKIQAPDPFAFYFSWFKMKNFTAGEVYMAKGFTIGDKGYLLGGFLYNPDIAGNYRLTARLWEYDMAGNSWSEKKAAPYGMNFNMISFSYMNKGYTIIQNETKDMVEYDPAANSWTLVSHYPGQSENLVGFMIGDELYTGLGTDYNLYYNEFYRYSFSSKTWTRLNDFPGMSRDGSVAFMLNGKGYVATGRNYLDDTYLAELWEYDPGTDQWTAKADFPGAGRYMAVAFTLAGKGYIGLGTREYGEGYSDFWCYDAEKDKWERKDNYTGRGKWLNVVFSNGSQAFIGPGTNTSPYSSWYIWEGFNDLWEFVDN